MLPIFYGFFTAKHSRSMAFFSELHFISLKNMLVTYYCHFRLPVIIILFYWVILDILAARLNSFPFFNKLCGVSRSTAMCGKNLWWWSIFPRNWSMFFLVSGTESFSQQFGNFSVVLLSSLVLYDLSILPSLLQNKTIGELISEAFAQ